jgi:imidazolonepropionase-like amidohydrolase
MLPVIAQEQLADYIDVFCETGFFSKEETIDICRAGMAYGLVPKIHANQLHLSGGVQAGVEVGALSVDHLETMDEDKFNTNRELNISETGWSYWFYKPDTTEHPFNRKVTRLDSGRVICTKVIRQLYNVGEGKVVKLRDVNTPLYLFIVAVSEYDENGQPKGELIRRKLKIEWEDD